MLSQIMAFLPSSLSYSFSCGEIVLLILLQTLLHIHDFLRISFSLSSTFIMCFSHMIELRANNQAESTFSFPYLLLNNLSYRSRTFSFFFLTNIFIIYLHLQILGFILQVLVSFRWFLLSNITFTVLFLNLVFPSSIFLHLSFLRLGSVISSRLVISLLTSSFRFNAFLPVLLLNTFPYVREVWFYSTYLSYRHEPPDSTFSEDISF